MTVALESLLKELAQPPPNGLMRSFSGLLIVLLTIIMILLLLTGSCEGSNLREDIVRFATVGLRSRAAVSVGSMN